MSEEIIRNSPLLDLIALSGRRVKLDVGVSEMLVHLHHCCLVAAFVAVVWGGEDC